MSYLDTRDLYAELEELRARATDDDGMIETPQPLDEDETARLAALVELFDEIGENTGRHGETMIPDHLFAQYAEELADDIGAIDRNAGWPLSHIDWEAAAQDLKADYTEVNFDGTTYYVRLG